MTVAQYLSQIPQEQQPAFQKLRETILRNLPEGLQEKTGYGLSYVVPHSIYPDGYHCSPEDPLPFINISSRKNSINFSHMGVYADPKLKTWFQNQYAKHCKYKLDMGASCVRFKKLQDIPYQLITDLLKKMTVQDWIQLYEARFKK